MRSWSLIGLLLVLGAAVPLVMQRTTRAASTPAAAWMIGFSSELDAYARRHDGVFPQSFGDLIVERSAPHAASPVDPWNRSYQYERHPRDPRQCRVYTLGDPRRAGGERDGGTLALYRNGGLLQWKTDLDDLPYVWREALVPDEFADR